MEVTILLADAAKLDADGNLNALGLGWDTTGPPPLPQFVILLIIKAPLDWPSDQTFSIDMRLIDPHGEPVKLPGSPSAEIAFHIDGRIPPEDSRPPGLAGGISGAISVGAGLLLEPGIHHWVVSVQGQEWRRAFYVRGGSDEFKARIRMLDENQS